MTPAIVAGLQQLEQVRQGEVDLAKKAADMSPAEEEAAPSESSNPVNVDTNNTPALDEPELGKPISHSQIVQLWQNLKASQELSCSLELLLRGSRVYIPPPPPKPEPTPQFKALMARLRREEEALAYERMVNPPPRHETFHDRFPHAASAASFAAVNRPVGVDDLGDDDVTYNEIKRQVMLLINFLVSIAGVAGTLWVAARWWTLPARLFLTMGGAALVGVAEVAVYSVYVWRMGEAKQKQDQVKEVKEVVKTWVVGQHDEGEDKEGEAEVLLKEKDNERNTDESLRKRKPTSKVDE
ncbi:hypothetical protein HJFPF1_12631 [Paramyrothecium foliicola]|nr:hypothetical protein HJFPF1_12631 [Paramyrothecium foliicola]